MMTNKLKYLFVGLCIVFASCDPLDEVYDELDETATDANQVSLAYDLTAADYDAIAAKIKEDATEEDTVLAEFIEDNEVITTEINPTEFIPNILESNFPHLGNTSAIQVRYRLFQGEISETSQKYLDESITLTKPNYAEIGGDAAEFGILTNVQTPDDVLPQVLEKVIQEEPSSGDTKLVYYEYLDTMDIPTPQPIVAFKEVNSAADTVGYTQVDITMDKDDYRVLVDYIQNMKGAKWIDSYGDLEYYYGANAHYANFDSRISKWKGWIGTTGDDIFEGTVTAEEDSARIAQRVLSGVKKYVGLTQARATSGNKVYNIQYKIYNGNDYYPISSFILDDASQDEEPVAPTGLKYGRFYTYTGSKWEMAEDVYYLVREDYNAMGITGKYQNFSDDNLPEDYLPTYLSNLFPYAQEGDSYSIAYNYFNGENTETIVETYAVTEGEWVGNRILTKEEQYIKSEGNWNLDPTVVFTMTKDDYQIIVDAVHESNPSLYDAKYKNQEWLYGAGAYYGNFDIRVSKRLSGDYAQPEYNGMSQEEAKPVLLDKAAEGVKVLLQKKYSSLPAQVNGIDVFVKVTFATYDGTNNETYKVEFQSKGGGTFELIEGPTKQI